MREKEKQIEGVGGECVMHSFILCARSMSRREDYQAGGHLCGAFQNKFIVCEFCLRPTRLS